MEQRLPHSLGPSPELGGIMTVGARLRSKAASSLVGRRPLGRLRRAGDEETDAIVEHLEGEDEDPASPDCEREEGGRRAGTPSARRVHLAALPERYDSLEEPAPGDKPKKRYRRKLKKYGKVGPHGPAALIQTEPGVALGGVVPASPLASGTITRRVCS